MRDRRSAIGDPRFATRDLRFAICALVLFALTACGTTAPAANGWAIAAVDPQTGDVGVAGAACSDYPFDYRAALRPGHGALAQLGVASPLMRDRVSAWIVQPLSAAAIAERFGTPQDDPAAGERGYALVTLQDGTPQARVWMGGEVQGGAMSANPTAGHAAIAGTGLASAEVVDKTRAAFESAPDALTLSDRLMRALEAGSAAGGTALCDANGVQQTASTAFVMLARHGDADFQVQTLGNKAAQEPTPPFLALSVSEPNGGRNAVASLRAQYETWRAANLPPCEACAAAQLDVPSGGTLAVAQDAGMTRQAFWLVMLFVLLVAAATIAFFALRPRGRRSAHTRGAN